jgi:hypothetical protein
MADPSDAPVIEAAFEGLLAAVRADELLAVRALGWATVDLDRAAAAFEGAVPGGGPYIAGADDEWLGARCRLGVGRSEGHQLVLLEPSTEGRLAAHLARYGEGPVAAWVEATAETGGEGRWTSGPFGRERPLGIGGSGPGVLLLVTERTATIGS